MKKVIVALIIACLTVTMIVPFNVAAAGNITVSGGTFEVGQTFEINVKLSHTDPIVAASVHIEYNSSVLSLVSVSGAQYTTGNSSIDIADDAFTTAEKEVKSGSYRLKFKAVAAGNSNITANAKISVTSREKSTPSASATVTVITPKPSSNANLASIKLSNGALSPAFNPNTTKYDVTVKYSVDSITITGAIADGGATYTGGGTFDLEVGNNSRVLTVTAADGTKKSYTINIKRMTEQETADAEQAARDANPLLVIIDGVDYTIVNDLENVEIPAGFTQATATRKESEITVLNDAAGKYQLCYLVDANGEDGAFYSRDSEDNFTKLAYINANGVMYIIEKLNIDKETPAGFTQTTYTINGVEVEMVAYEDENLSDFCIFNCFVAGATENTMYRYDTVEGTMQRAVDFDTALIAATTDAPVEQPEDTGKLAWFTKMNNTGKAVFFIIVLAAVILVAVAIILIVKIASSGKEDYNENYSSHSDNDFVLNDFAQDSSDDSAE